MSSKDYEEKNRLLTELAKEMKSLADNQNFQLSEPFLRATSALAAERFNVVVMGEAKRGKSSFLNAIIGKNVLPVDVEVATCQLFRIEKSDEESYRVVFSGGDSREISLDALGQWGSQSFLDSNDALPENELVERIELRIPCAFLPNDIVIYDTPGLGALYAGHARVTYGLLPLADAVIFVLDSSSPVSEPELKLLNDVLEVTPNIFFIQTKIDTVGTPEWQAIRDRNQDILQSKLSGTLGQVRVWPVSNTDLLEAAETGDDEALEDSEFPELAVALRGFLQESSGYNRLAQLEKIIKSEACRLLEAMNGQIKSVTTASASDKTEAMNRLRELKEARGLLQREWGNNGTKRVELLRSTQEICTQVNQEFQAELAPGGRVHMCLEDEMVAVADLDELGNCVESLPQKLSTTTAKTCTELMSLGLISCDELVSSAIPESSPSTELTSLDGQMGSGLSTSLEHISMRANSGPEKSPLFLRCRGLMMGGMLGSGAATVVSIVFPPLALFSIPVVLLGAGLGYSQQLEAELEKAKAEAKTILNKLVRANWDELNRSNLTEGSSGFLKDRLKKMQSMVIERLEEWLTPRLDSLDKDLTILQAGMSANSTEMRAKIEDLRSATVKLRGLV